MNTKVAPWSDVHVRRAVAYAIKRSDFVNAIGGYATPQSTFIPAALLQTVASTAQVGALLKSIPQYTFDLAKAKAELAKSAYPNGFSFSLPDPGYYGTTSQALAAALQKIGIKATVGNVTGAAWFSQITTPAQRPATLVGGTCTSPSVAGFDWALGSKNALAGQFNIANYTPSTVDAWIAAGESAAASNKAKAFTFYSKLVRQLQLDMPNVPIFLFQNTIAFSKKFKFEENPGSIYGVTATGFWNTDWPLHIRRA
jgi:peptide/nickel transport system substrate-binding protein